ncbi:ribosomal RNA small subunit methyltransferase G [Thermobispora bispora]
MPVVGRAEAQVPAAGPIRPKLYDEEVMTESNEIPEPPAIAWEVFPGEAMDRARVYAELLAGSGVERGLLGPREVPRIWDRHMLNCGVVAEVVPENTTLVDIGSGAGLPGVVLAIIRPDVRVTLLEPLLRRTVFLSEITEILKLDNVEVLRGRAEELAYKRVFDVATARAVTPLDRLVAWSLPLLREGGELLAMKGERAAEEIENARRQLQASGARSVELVTVGEGKVEPPTTLVRVVAGRPPGNGKRRRRKR